MGVFVKLRFKSKGRQKSCEPNFPACVTTVSSQEVLRFNRFQFNDFAGNYHPKIDTEYERQHPEWLHCRSI